MATSEFDDDEFFQKPRFFWPLAHPRRFLHVRGQGRTNACYAITSVSTMYAEQSFREKPVQASAQELLDNLHIHKPPQVVPSEIPPEGLTSNFKNAFGYVEELGLYTEDQYPFVFKYQSIKPEINSNQKIFIKKAKYIKGGGDQVKVIRKLHKRPLAGCILLTPSFKDWKPQDGIYQGPTGDELKLIDDAEEKDIDPPFGFHALTVLGYGTEGGVRYLLCQNSYGKSWGHKGYVKVARHLVRQIYYPKLTSLVDKRKRKVAKTGTSGSGKELGGNTAKKVKLLSPTGTIPNTDSQIAEKEELLKQARKTIDTLSDLLNSATEPKQLEDDQTMKLLESCNQFLPHVLEIVKRMPNDNAAMLTNARTIHTDLRKVISRHGGNPKESADKRK